MHTGENTQPDPHTIQTAGQYFTMYTTFDMWIHFISAISALETSPDFEVMEPNERANLVAFLLHTHQLVHLLTQYEFVESPPEA